MAKPYKLTPIELALSPKEHFEDNLNKFINNETIADDEKLILLQNALRRVDKHKPYRERPLKVNVIESNKEMTPSSSSSSSSTTIIPKEEEDLSKVMTSVADLMPHSYREQCKRLLTYLNDSEHVQIDANGNQVVIHGKTYILLDLLSDLVTNRKRLVSFDSHLHTFLNSSNFPKSLIANKHILKRLKEFSQISKDVFKSFSENTSTPSGNNDLTRVMSGGVKRRRLNITASPSPSPVSMQMGSGHFTTCLRSKWLKH